ncbi:DUF4249 domain-containing protein [Muricauda sp. 2012CJ35-5]|uniref:DUF4249 domain-containing protein n=1 Tax=Flagellimonas spongiicola TaxID=2942208 RepID=A0ABT0PNW5_9FLAO|nr:DUF4249 family protein [Allomuricauda spongiicola]MCL6273054.1 DUF4249 domain-containing protein [Allomuricauda spongiicola]
MSQYRYGLKHSLLLILLSLCMASCEDVINPDLPTSDPQLVIDALLGYNANNGNPITAGQIKLTLTAPFLVNDVPAAVNAQVKLIDESTGQEYPLSESETGVFDLGMPTLQFGREYTLEVMYQGETYRATQQLVNGTVIDNLEQADGFLFDEEEETEVKVTFTDIPNQRNYYFFAFGFENFLVVDDEFFQNQQLTFSYFYEDINPGRLITVTLFGVDKDFANYAEQVLTQAGEEGNSGPFSVPVSNVRGNIINTTNPNHPPFGYFVLSEFNTRSLTIE